MNNNFITTLQLPQASAQTVARVRQLEEAASQLPQVEISTKHVFHGGMYARTIMIPAGVVLTGAEIKIPTILIINGQVMVSGDNGPVKFSGYNVTLGEIGRKQAFLALTDTWFTMIFPTKSNTVEAAEMEFTNEYKKLFSRREA